MKLARSYAPPFALAVVAIALGASDAPARAAGSAASAIRGEAQPACPATQPRFAPKALRPPRAEVANAHAPGGAELHWLVGAPCVPNGRAQNVLNPALLAKTPTVGARALAVAVIASSAPTGGRSR